MIDVQKVNSTKEKITATIRASGPSFPAKISRETGIQPLFIGALLSEMVSEKKLIMSSMKIGSSPLYFIPGQESSLENFTNYLNSKEREAFTKLKQEKIIDDESQDPAIRVALRKVRDFAIPLTVRQDNKERLFWKFFNLSDQEAQKMIEQILEPQEKKEIQKETPKQEKIEKDTEEILQVVKPKTKKVTKEKTTSVLKDEAKEYLTSKDIELLEDITIKAKEYHARIRIDSPFGKQEYLLIAKDKKKLTEDDLAAALHKASTEKMPAYILVKGDVDKNAKPYLDQWKNLLKVEKLKS